MQRCPQCDEENPDRFRLCGFCGAELAPAVAPEEVRKTVTILYCDLKGSTSLGERVDTESLRGILNRYFEEMKRVLERHGGSVEKFIGDAVMAVFGLPRVHEDDALRAVRAAADMQQALTELNVQFERTMNFRLVNRTGINTGEVVVGSVAAGHRLVTGDTVNTAARLEAAAPELSVLMGESTYRLVKDAVEVEPPIELELKGKAEPVLAYRLIRVAEAGVEGLARRQDAPMVGRRGELRALEAAFGAAVLDRSCRVFTILGQAGVGKSRLVAEFVRSSGPGVRVLRGRCLPYGEGASLWPLAEMVRHAAGIAETDEPEQVAGKIAVLLRSGGSDVADVADRVAAAIGRSPNTYRMEELFWGARKLFQTLASHGPLVVVFDDLHWAEATLLELIEHVATSAADIPLLLVCMARPEMLDDRPEWRAFSGGGLVQLEPLSDGESAEVVENLLGSADLPEDLRSKIVVAAEGNPLFVEQLLSMLIDDGVLRRTADATDATDATDGPGGWTLAERLGTLSVPPSISALLSARLERLSDAERAVVERASVIGQVFWREEVEALAPDALRERVGGVLSTLTRKEFVRPDAAAAGEDAFRFHHILIRDAAYVGLLKKTRADLHERYVDWLEGPGAAAATEMDELVGYHLEQAYRYRLELAPGDEPTAALGAKASARLSVAGRRALARGDGPAAVRLLQRAAGTLAPNDPVRFELLADTASAYMDSGAFGPAEAALDEVLAWTAASGDRSLEARAMVVRLYLRFMTASEGWSAAIAQSLQDIIPVLERAQDHLWLARAWALLGYVHGVAFRFGAAEEAVGRALAEARLAGDRREEARNLSAYAQSALYGPMPVPEAIVRCEALLGEAHGDHKAEAMILCSLARLNAMAAQPGPARALYRRSRAMSEDLGSPLQVALTAIDSGPVEMLGGDLEAAEHELRRDYDALEAMGEKAYLSTTAALLARVMVEQGRPDEADRYGEIAERSASSDDVETLVLARCARGLVLAFRGRFDDGEALIRGAVGMIEGTEQPNARGMVLLDLAHVLAMAGKRAESEEVARRAAELFAEKGNVVSAGRASALLAEVRSGAGPP